MAFAAVNGSAPDRYQTAMRAEIWTGFSTLKFVAKLGKPARLWIDNQVVVQKFRKWMQGPWTPHSRPTDGDLWQVTFDQFLLVRHLIQAVFHAHSHNGPTAQKPPRETEQQTNRPHRPVKSYSRNSGTHGADQNASRLQGRQVMQMYAEICIAAMQAESQQAVPSPEGVQVNMPSQRREQDPSFEILAEMEVDDIPDHYQCDEVAHILRWVKTIACSVFFCSQANWFM